MAGFPEANIKEFLVTILSEAKWMQIQRLSPTGEFWIFSEANSRIVRNSFQRAKGNLANIPRALRGYGTASIISPRSFLSEASINVEMIALNSPTSLNPNSSLNVSPSK